MTRIRTLEFLPEIFQTPTNSQFLGATLDQLVNPPVTNRIEGYVGSKLGYGINAKDYYVPEPTKERKDYQLEPGIVFTKTNESVAKDFISYPGLLDALLLQNGITNNNDRLFKSQFYSWDSFTNLDAIINYNQYYWLPEGPPAVTVGSATVFLNNEYLVTDEINEYNIKTLGAGEGTDNPTITLLRGGTYQFIVDQDSEFWIQGEPGVSGYSPLQSNLYTRDILGVTNNGATSGIVTFVVPQKNAQDEYIFSGFNFVGVVSNKPFSQINGYKLSQIGGSIDSVTSLNGRTVLFYDTGIANEIVTIDGSPVVVNDYFFEISYTGDPYDPTLVLTPATLIPTEEKLIPIYGTEYINLNFYKTSSGSIAQVPYLSADLDVLYYQDGSSPNKTGTIKLIESNALNTINVDTDILGKKNFTSSNGVVFTNGLKVVFDGDVIPASYLQGEYYVEGVGTAIELIPVLSLTVPEEYTDATSIPFDSTAYDIGNFDSNLYIPLNQDYITIARNARNKNAWARSNRWFHIEVIRATAQYLQNPNILTTFASATNKAVRPIIEFYPNIQLYNSGTIAKNAVDFIDTRTTDAFDLVAGQATYYPDVETYTDYTGTIYSNPTVYTGDYIPGQQYKIIALGTTTVETWQDVGATLTYDGNFVPGVEYIITSLGTTDWNDVAGTIAVSYNVGDIFTAKNQGTVIGAGSGTALTVLFTAEKNGQYNSSELKVGQPYYISALGTTTWTLLGAVEKTVTNCSPGVQYYIKSLGNVLQKQWNTLAGTTGVTYNVGDLIEPVTTLPVGDGKLIQREMVATSTGIGTGFAAQGNGYTKAQTVTTISIPAIDVTGNLSVGMYINDVRLNQQSILPVNTRILSVSGTDTITMQVFWPIPTIVTNSTVTNASFVANTKNNNDLSLFSGARVVFAAESTLSLRNKIYVANFSSIGVPFPVITLTEAVDGQVLDNDQFVVTRGQINQGNSFYYKNNNYILAQQKPDINIPPKFDVYDNNGISFGDPYVYEASTFEGSELFRYKLGSGTNDSVLGFPITYSSINNVGDITFEVALNTDTFNYVSGLVQTEPVTANVNTGFVHNALGRTEFELLTGWQTAVAPSTQYQVFEFTYEPNVPATILEIGETIAYTVTCDVVTLPRTTTIWPNIQVYNNNVLLNVGTDYTVVFDTNETTVQVNLSVDEKTVIQVLLLSDQVSNNAYYTIPINLSNNPFNTDVTTVDLGDIRGHYQTIFDNNPDVTGVMFGSNNTRDLGNIVPWGTRIIQNSASLVLPGAFLRNSNHNLFDALEYNSREYIKFKTLLIDTINKTSYDQRFDPAYILDDALDQIASVKNQDMPFFWSDMIPNKAAYITNIYTIQNPLTQSIYPLSQIYDFTTANYNGLLIYVETTIDGVRVTKQLYKNIDYIVSTESPSVTVTKDLIQGDRVIVKEYNQTYGSYIPNTPTKLGLYPVSIPGVVLDTSYNEPTYFIKGHDGSYTKLYGDYIPAANLLVDYRDQALLEYEIRVYNNLKLSSIIPIKDAEVVPGYFRDTAFSYNEWLQMYSPQFLNWIGQNRLDYKTQLYLNSNSWTYNYKNSQNRLNNTLIDQGYWRGIYQYYYDTSTPDQTPWEMIGYANKPNWWEDRYGPAPYTSDNLILWTDLQNGVDYNNGVPVTLNEYKRPGLLNIIPVNGAGELLDPFDTIVGNYNSNTLQRDWVVGDDSPVEFSYRRSSTFPYDLMRLYALMQPANFFNLAVDLDNYKYDPTLNQFLFNGRSHLVPSEIQIYGNGTAKTSYINWIVDYEKQAGIGATENIQTLLNNLDVRLVYRLAGFSDKTLLKFFVEKGTPNSRNASLLIPDESYSVLLYENQPYSRLIYSSVVIQLDSQGYRVYGNSQNVAYFNTLKPIYNSNTSTITIQDQQVKIANNYSDAIEYVPYGTLYYTVQEVAQFLMSYGKYLETQGVLFTEIESGIEVNWTQMIAEFLYWSQVGWQIGSIVTLNPAASTIKINKESRIVQPLTLQQTNFILNQNLYPIDNKDLAIYRDGSEFSASVLNSGDTIAYGQFNLSNIEHGIVFDNTTLFNDTIYNLISGLKQNRIYVRGTKSAEWNGTMFASGFIYNQDNIQEWTGDIKYTKGAIVKYKNKFWTALKIIQAGSIFSELDWKETEYDEIQKGLLPNPSTRSYESALYYNSDKANLEQDADQLSFSLIGFRPRPYMVSADLTDITQVNVYKNMIKEKGTRNVLNAFKGAQLPQGGIDYNIYENWAILSGQFGGVLNSNFVEFKLNENKITANPSIVGLTNGNDIEGAQQLVPLYSLFNYGRPITNTDVLPTLPNDVPNVLYPDAGYVNLDDVKMSAYFYSNLPAAVDKNRLIVPINRFYVNDYVWIADYLAKWQILTPYPIGQVIQVRSNLNGTATVFFRQPHNLEQFNIFSIINFDDNVNGYYVAAQIINPYQIIINLNLTNNNRQITGEGIALGFNNHRVDKPSDIQDLSLLDYEFVKNKVWVDESVNGGWAVYRKSNNYTFDTELTVEDSVTFGTSVNYTLRGDFLVGDSGAGKVYRYQYDSLSNDYDPDQILDLGSSFGTSIASAENIIAISKPTSAVATTRMVALYVVNDTYVTDDLLPYQNNNGGTAPVLPWIIAPSGSTNFGQSLAFSDDSNYLYISDFNEETPVSRNKVHLYRKNNILTQVPFTVGQTYQITELGNTDFTEIGAKENKVGIYFIATDVGNGTGKATQCNYQLVNTIDGPNTYAQFTASIETGPAPYGDRSVLVVTAVSQGNLALGQTVYGTDVQSNTQIVSQLSGTPGGIGVYLLSPTQTNRSSRSMTANAINKFGYSLSTNYNGDMLVVGAPHEDYDNNTANWGRAYVYQKLYQNFEVQTTATNQLFTLSWTPDSTKPLSVYVNGTYKQATTYSLSGSTITITSQLKTGDIVTVKGNDLVLIQTLESTQDPKIGVQFGNSVDTNKAGTEILVGSPFELNETNQEGAVDRYTYGSARFGYITGTDTVNVTANRNILLNGYQVTISPGDAANAALTINLANITNIEASNSNGILTINLVNNNIAQVNQELIIGVTDNTTLDELGFELLTNTQKILCPHVQGPTQFGTTIKFNEFNSVVISAPTGTRYALTTFDFTDDENLDNDTIFDNNATQFLDTFNSAGAVYMFDYLENYNETLLNIGKYTYAQSCNAQNLVYGQNPYYGLSLDFAENKVVIGTPYFRPSAVNGQAVVYVNETGIQNWDLYRESNPVVDISRIQNIQMFSAETNNTLINLDYMDPLQGKLLGAVSENIDVVSNIDPATYNNSNNTQSGFVWGASKVGTIWFDTTNVRFINYHQNDNTYNARYWGTLFPGSDVAIYSWIASNVPPTEYAGLGVPKDINLYTVQTVLNSSNQVTPVYYFWVRNTGIVFSGKSLADITLAEYIANPQNSGISYFAPLAPDTYAVYNSQQFVNANDTVLHIGYSTSDKDDPAHQEFCLVREDFASDFLPGFPNANLGIDYPESLYDRLLDSLSGTDETGAVVPDPFLPKAVQSGVLARPRQSFFYNRYLALKNYLQFVNSVLELYPITELRRPTDLERTGTYYNVPDYWEYINWWAVGFNNNTRAAIQVPLYADLSVLTVSVGTIVTVSQNSQGLTETYIYDGDGVWTRIGLQNGTIRFKSELFDYELGKFGFGGDFFSSTSYDQYPSEETRWIIRSINEQIFTNELLIFRNQGLILLFEYIQAETVENQNYLPWLNKTSLVDVGHTIRELLPLQNFTSDNQEFLSGYVNEAKPYHVVIKEFLFNYTGRDIYQGNLTDFDLPATFDSSIDNFVSPQLVYNNPNTSYEFLPNDPVWTKQEYNEWFNNYGVSLTGQDNYLMTVLASYVTLSSDFMVVDNAQGFPINGVIKIASISNPNQFEYIGYNSVDRALNVLSGLVRGLYESEPFDHIPGENIYIDLPPVVVLDGGQGYVDPPKVIAYIDESIYPTPKQEAVLEAVMSLDSVVSINVVNPGQGYAVLPEIIIEAAQSFDFSSSNVNVINNTIEVYAPSLETGNLVRYVSGTDNIGGLKDDQYYYINVLGTIPASLIALYTTYKDAVSDTNRVKLYSQGTGTHTFEQGARASAISTSYPVRENNITLRYDRTTYNSQVTDWAPNNFYGASFAGSYNNTENVSSSSIDLQSINPNINNILASNGGVVFPITSVSNDRQVDWSLFERNVSQITSNKIRLSFTADPLDENPSKSTIGFTIGMPVKFTGDTGPNIVEGTTYYVAEINDLKDFKISATQGGPALTLSNFTVGSAGMKCFTAQVVDTAVLTVNYPGIRQVTASNAITNILTVPLNAIGQGGTQGLYTGISLVFTGTTFGGIEENVVYYVTSVIDSQSFTISENNNPLTLQVTSINGANQLIMPSAVGLNVNDKIIFSNMMIDNQLVTDFGNIIQGQTYYVKEIGINVITISATAGGPELDLDPVAENPNTYAFFTSQEDVLQLTNGSGSMTMNIQLPVSPGQVNGQEFTLYKTSEQYPNITPTVFDNLVEQTVQQTLASTNVITIENFDRLYNGFPFTLNVDVGGLYTDRTYYMTDLDNITVECASTSVSTCTINATFSDLTMTVTSKSGTGQLYPGSIITGTGLTSGVYVIEQVSGTTGGVGVYTISILFITPVSFTGLTGSAGICSLKVGYLTNMIYNNMPIVFSGSQIGNIILGEQYYVRHIVNGGSFIISDTIGGAAAQLVAGTGVLIGTGAPSFKAYLKAGTFKIGDSYDINFIGTTNFAAIGATLAVNNTTGFVVGQKYIIQNIGTTTNTQWNVIAGTINVTYKVGDIFTAARTSFRTGNGAAYLVRFTATGIGLGTGSAIVILSNSSTNAIITQKIVQDPVFDISYILGGYRALITNGGEGFAIDNTITINGSLIGGTTPKNNLVLTVNQINSIEEGTYIWSTPVESTGIITDVICAGTPAGITNNYYLKVKTANQFEVYSDQLMQVPVSGIGFPYAGFTTTTATNATASDNSITVSSSTNFNVNDPVVFTGTVFAIELQLGKVYYIYDKPSATKVRLTDNPGGSVIDITIDSAGSMTMAKAGSFALLPQPFYFNESIVKYNNRVYVCVVSNNDDEFVFGKWEELNSGDRRLNAMDRVVGYYQPSVNMPGRDLEQLFEGVTYPNATYLGNKFDPAEQFNVDTILQDQAFYPTNVNLISAIYNGNYYMFAANLPNYSAIVSDVEVTDNWLLRKLSNKPLAITSLTKANNKFIMTSTNSATPLMISTDGAVYSTNGYYIPYGTATEDIPYVKTRLISNNLSYNAVAYGNGKYVAVGSNIITSTNLSLWEETYTFGSSAGELSEVKFVDNSFFTGFVAVGYKTTSKIILYSTDGITWTQVATGSFSYGSATVPQQNATLRSITFNSTSIVIVGDLGVIYRATAMNSWTLVQVVAKPMNAVLFANNLFVTVGDQGHLYKSSDGTSWTLITPPTTENLNSLNYETTNSIWTVVGNNNTVLQTLDINAVSVLWDSSQIFETPEPIYTIKGDPFQAGYGPEELVPGIVSDQLTMIVTTRAGTNWPASEYASVGYNVVSIELEPNVSNSYSFANIVEVPMQLSVFRIVDGVSTSLYVTNDYTINWIDKTVTLNSNITGSQMLRIDIYEAGNGDQLVKSNTDDYPIVTNSVSGFDELYLNCPYSGLRVNGGGLIRPTTAPIDDIATETKSDTDEIIVTDITQFVLNGQIYFTGDVFGGVLENTPYYVKSINLVKSSITISDSLPSGIAGPIYGLTNGTGSMIIVIQTGPGTFYTEPAVYFNGNKLLSGKTNYIVRTNASNDVLITYSTTGLIVNQPIVFDDNIIGGLTAHTTYYIKSILSSTEFTVSATVGGAIIPLTDEIGTSIFVTNDYSASMSENSNAKIIFAASYDLTTDYLAFSFFTETEPEQYGYTLPATQVIIGTGGTEYNLSNYLGDSNPTNAIVEVDGLRLMPTEYSIDAFLEKIIFDTAVASTSKIAVTTFNDTNRQYLNTQSFTSTVQVTPISFVNNVITAINRTTTVTTSIAHGLSTNDVVRIDGVAGAYQLDNTLFIIKVTSPTTFELYEYIPGYTYEYSVPIVDVNTYTSGGYVWLAYSWMLQTTTATASNSYSITVSSVSDLVVGTPVIFTEIDIPIGASTSIPEIIAGQTYYINSIDSATNKFTITDTRGGDDLPLSTTTGKSIRVTQWEQFNVDRLWVTVNGERVASSLLKLNEANELSILLPITVGDEIIITSMVPSSTPNEMVYLNLVDSQGNGSVYRANSDTRTWLTESVGQFDNTITVNNINNITNRNEQTNATPAAVLGYHTILLDATKDDIIDITVYNNNPARLGFIDEDYVQLEVTGTGPYVKITAGSWIQAGDSLTIVSLEGKLLYVNGEYMRVQTVNPITKTIEVIRGVNGTSVSVYIPKYTTVYSLLEDNRMTQASYNDTWNKIPGVYNQTLGDPLQIATGAAPNFLRVDN